MANEYVEEGSDDDEEEEQLKDSNIAYEQFCNKMFRDFKVYKLQEKVEKEKAHLFMHNICTFKKFENVLKANIYDKRIITSKNIRAERQRLKLV